MYQDKVQELFEFATKSQALKKAVFSKPDDKELKRTEAVLYSAKDGTRLQLAHYLSSGKVKHTNLPLADASRALKELCSSFGQCNLATASGDAQIIRKKDGSFAVVDRIKRTGAYEVSLPSHNAARSYILPQDTYVPFLHELGISDKTGRVYDKKTDKFRQINRFLEIFAEALDGAGLSSCVSVADLCCGKSYLTFAVHHYLTAIKGRDAEVTGIDRKGELMELCSDIVERHSMKGLSFLEGDINDYKPQTPPDVVISLHACDIATDIVISNAVKWGSGIILSSPCCQHELYGQMKASPIPPLTDYPLIKQRLCELATDSLRGLALETAGYNVDMVEFVGVEDTPKNLMIRAVKRPKPLSTDKREELICRYRTSCETLGVVPSIGKLMGI
ncbi:MAG: SAM-dependent methyltransferase [Eubacteriales bacterium]